MSFILDALRKSEHERQRQSGPGLAEVAVAVPRPKGNVWATAAVALLVVNLLAVGVLLWRRANAPVTVDAATVAVPEAPPAADRAPVASSARPTSNTATAPATAQADAPAPASTSTSTSTSTTGIPPMLQPADAPGPASVTRNPLELEMAEGSTPLDPVLAERGASVPAGPPAVTEYETQPGSVVYETAPGTGSSPDASSGLPTIDDVAAQGGFPEMHLDLHVFSSNPQDRFVFVNKRKYREGETLQEGPLVEQITRDGVVLSQHGRRFIMPRQ